MNAAVCVAAAAGVAVAGLLGPDAVGAAGSTHPGLPWAGRSILGANAAQLALLRPAASPGVHVADMPADAQLTRIYDEYLGRIAARLVLSVRIVDGQVAAVLEKLDARTRRDAATRARALGLCR